MIRKAWGIPLTLLLVSSVFAAPPIKPALVDEATPPPRFVSVRAIDVGGGELQIDSRSTVAVPIVAERIEVTDGREKKVTEVTYVYEERVDLLKFSLVRGRVVTAAGEEVPDRELAKVLKPGVVVLLSSDLQHGHISQSFARLLKPETILLLGKLPPAGGGPSVNLPGP